MPIRNVKNLFPLLLINVITVACGQTGGDHNKANETDYFKDVTAEQLPSDSAAHILDVALADVDKDGDLDALLAVENQPNRLYLNDGNGMFTWKKNVFANEPNDTEHVRVADFNKDGKVDVVFVAEDNKQHEYYLGNGKGGFENVSNRLLAKSEANGLDVADVNGDVLPDIVVGNTGKNAKNFLWLNKPQSPGHFIDATQDYLPALAEQTQSVKLADLDGDVDADLLTGNEVPPNRLFINDGQGRFTQQPLDLPVPLHTREVIVFDANGDKRPDILFANLTSNGGPWEKDPRARLLINKGQNNFKDETEQRMPHQSFSTYAANVVDFNGDGFSDIILSAIKTPPFEAMQVQALQNDGKGNFSSVTGKVIPAITTGRTWGIATGDVNNDGKIDLFIGGWGTQARLLLGK